MPGFDLARLCAQRLEAELTADTIGMVLLNNGIFPFGESAKASYERMIDLVEKAEAYLRSRAAWNITITDGPAEHDRDVGLRLAGLRSRIADAAGFALVMRRYTDPVTMAFVSHRDLASIAQQGPTTPDHVIRTKRLPMIGEDVDAYVTAYKVYFAENEPLASKMSVN